MPVIHVKDNTYICSQGLEFIIKKKDWEFILLQNNSINVDKNLLKVMPSILKQHVNDGLLTLWNIQTYNKKRLKDTDINFDEMKALGVLLNDMKNGLLKKD
jgi:hypothetical protein